MPKPVVTAPAGSLSGIRRGDVESFRGIPYAAPPVGELRWKAPRPAKGWSGVRDASTFGAACIQKEARQEPEKSLKSYPQGEDCLTLNVWRPRISLHRDLSPSRDGLDPRRQLPLRSRQPRSL